MVVDENGEPGLGEGQSEAFQPVFPDSRETMGHRDRRVRAYPIRGIEPA